MRWLAAAVVLAVVAVTVAGDSGRSARTPDLTGLPDLVVYLRKDVTEPQKREIGVRLAALPEVRGTRFESREEAYRRFREQFKHVPALVDATRPESMPESWLVYLAPPGSCAAVAAQVAALPGVDEVLCAPPSAATPSP